MSSKRDYNAWERRQRDAGTNIARAREQIKSLKIETPSWGYSDAGTRFKVFKMKGNPSSIFQKLDDAAQTHRFTGVCPSVAIHIPWDEADDYKKVADYAEKLNLRIGAVNPNLFQEEEYVYGSLCNSKLDIRRKAIDHMKECADIARATGSKILSLWISDGTNYPGQGDFRNRKSWLQEAFAELAAYMDDDMRMLIEYKTFEPGFYHTDIADWGMSYAYAQKAGKMAQVLVDLGHHPLGTNIEHIVAFLLDEGVMGGFHFNNKKYADDDLIAGSVNPYELFLIFLELVKAGEDQRTAGTARNIVYMIDQSHCIEPKIPAMIRSVMNVQTAQAKALLVDLAALKKAQADNDVMAAEAIVRDAFETDVRPLLESVRDEMGVPADPMEAYLKSGYEEKKLSRA